MNRTVKAGTISHSRRMRLVNEVAPLVAKGMNCYEVAAELGISKSMAANDLKLVRKIWLENNTADMDEVRAEGTARFEDLYKVAREAYDSSVEQGRPNDKFLSLAGNFLEKKNKLQGLNLDVSLVQQNLTIHGEADPATVVGAFAPMNPDEYTSFIEQKGSLTQLPPIPEEKEEELGTKKAAPEGTAEIDWQ